MKKVSYLASGVVIGMVLTLTTPVLAETAKTISAKINSTVEVVINGKETKLSAQPINYNNLNYLPVGEIGRALGLTVKYDKGSDTINIDESSTVTTASIEITPTPTPTQNTTSSTNSTQAVKVGENVTKDNVTISVSKIEYVKEEERVDGFVLDKGFKIYIDAKNNSDYLLQPTLSYQFTTTNGVEEQSINNIGGTYFLKTNDGRTFMGDPLNKGESISGFIFYSYDKDVDIKEVHYYLSLSGVSQTTTLPMGTWTVN